jgi:hypothetical protein
VARIADPYGLTGVARNPQAHYNVAPTNPVNVVRRQRACVDALRAHSLGVEEAAEVSVGRAAEPPRSMAVLDLESTWS